MKDESEDPSEEILPEVGENLDNRPQPEPITEAERHDGEEAAAAVIDQSLVELGFVNFDTGAGDNATSGAMVSAERRKNFRRDVYVGVRDKEQGLEFLGRIVEGPFHSPHEVGTDSAITRTTVLYPERTRFRPTFYVHGSIEVLGQLTDGERVVPTATRPRPYSEIYIFPPDRLRRLLGIEGSFLLGELMGYTGVLVHADVSNKNFLPRNLGIFGTVGSGKSNTTQVLIEEALEAGWAVVVIDVEGEYVRMNEPTPDVHLCRILRETYGLAPRGVSDFKVYVPSSGSSDATAPLKFKVPISALEADILGDILEFSEPQIRMFGLISDGASRAAPGGGGTRRGVLGAPGGSSSAPYSLQTLIDGLTEDQNGNFPLVPRAQAAERTTASALRSKLIRLGRSGMLDWNATRSIPDLPVVELLVGGRLSVIDVSETDDTSRNLGIAYALQSLFAQVIETSQGEKMPSGGLRPKLLVVIEEVHTFVSRATASKMRSVLDNLQIISRRGRKRWMALALVSQQPSHVPDELFELANTRFMAPRYFRWVA